MEEEEEYGRGRAIEALDVLRDAGAADMPAETPPLPRRIRESSALAAD